MEVPLHAVKSPHSSGDVGPTFEGFVGATSARLFRALFLVTGSRTEAEDLMQDAFLAVWERWERVSLMDDPTGYLFRTGMNLWRKRLRRLAVAGRRTVRVAPPRDDFEAVEERDAVFRAMRGLKPKERAALVVTTLLDRPAEEAASMLGMHANTVRMYASRGRAALQETMEDPR